MKPIVFRHRQGTTRIALGRGVLKDSADLIGALQRAGRFLVVTNRRVNRLHGASLFDRLESLAGYEGKFFIPDSERAKDMQYAQKLYEKLILSGFDRTGALVAFGGGVCLDLTGFAASTFMRGIRWLAIPTTLIGQIDAAVGGKTAVNHPAGKNLIGTFWHPSSVWIDPEVLGTLERRNWVAGLAEMIKYGMIADSRILSSIEKNLDAVMRIEKDPVDRLIARCVRIKISVVKRDELDTGYRHVLNFGHTLAHALETHGRYKRISHGHAVAAGMLFAANVAVRLGICESRVYSRLAGLLKITGLHPDSLKIDPEALIGIFASDKKRKGDRIRFVLPVRAGRVMLKDIPLKTLANNAFWRFE